MRATTRHALKVMWTAGAIIVAGLSCLLPLSPLTQLVAMAVVALIVVIALATAKVTRRAQAGAACPSRRTVRRAGVAAAVPAMAGGLASNWLLDKSPAAAAIGAVLTVLVALTVGLVVVDREMEKPR